MSPSFFSGVELQAQPFPKYKREMVYRRIKIFFADYESANRQRSDFCTLLDVQRNILDFRCGLRIAPVDQHDQRYLRGARGEFCKIETGFQESFC